MSTPDPVAGLPAAVEIYDTTLRDGVQLEGISLTVADKLRIAEQLDRLGVHYIEGGWPGSNPKDVEFFARARTELNLERSKRVALGSTRPWNVDAAQDANRAQHMAAEPPVVGRSCVSKLSFTSIGAQKRGVGSMPAARSASRFAARSSAPGFTTVIALSVVFSYASIRPR